MFEKPKAELDSSVNTLRLLRMSKKLQDTENNNAEKTEDCHAVNIFKPPFETLSPSIGCTDK